jgi:hypothetical protein
MDPNVNYHSVLKQHICLSNPFPFPRAGIALCEDYFPISLLVYPSAGAEPVITIRIVNKIIQDQIHQAE